jgi:hypothetical protein
MGDFIHHPNSSVSSPTNVFCVWQSERVASMKKQNDMMNNVIDSDDMNTNRRLSDIVPQQVRKWLAFSSVGTGSIFVI